MLHSEELRNSIYKDNFVTKSYVANLLKIELNYNNLEVCSRVEFEGVFVG